VRRAVDWGMPSQIAAVVAEFDTATERLLRLTASIPDDAWRERPRSGGWSVAECVAHLNLTSRGYLPLLEDALVRARSAGNHRPSRRYRRDVTGWLLWRTMGPPVRFGKVNTTPSFVPSGDLPKETLVAEFEALQAAQVQAARAADGLPLGRVRIVSPFSARVRYNLYSCLSILPRHQHRHLWQAEEAWKSIRRR
jgi:hypothetical protein